MTKSGVLTVTFVAFFFTTLVSGSFPKAQNVSWQSTNFKTLLTWEPKPSSEYSYTVEFSVSGENRKKNKFCVRTTETSCDLSSDLTELKKKYTADILSEPPLGVNSDLTEFPHTRSPRFCPYEDTDIGSPDFKVVKGDQRNVTLYVNDPQTALFVDGRLLTIRDVFADDLQYKVTYRRAQSSGQKVKISKSSEIQLTGLDRGESYCFQVQAYIPSRRADKQLGAESRPQCSHKDNTSILDKYSVGAIAGAILLLLAVVGVAVGVAIFCVRRRRNAAAVPEKTAEGAEPLNV